MNAEGVRLPAEFDGEKMGLLEIGVVSRVVEIAIMAMAESLTCVEQTHPAQTYEALAPGMAYREAVNLTSECDIRLPFNQARTGP